MRHNVIQLWRTLLGRSACDASVATAQRFPSERRPIPLAREMQFGNWRLLSRVDKQ